MEQAGPLVARHATTIAAANIDGKLASLLSNEEIRELLPNAPVAERLAVISAIHECCREPPATLPPEALGERSVALYASGRTRENVILVQEAVILLNGLLATISAAALLTPQCIQDPRDTITGWTCTPLQGADTILWTLCLMFQTLSVGLGLSNMMAVAILHEEEEYREWLLNNWMKHQSSMAFGVNSFVFLIPGAFATRMWLHTGWPVALATTLILVASCLVVYNVLHNVTVNSALKLGLGKPTLTMKEVGAMGPKFWGEVGKPLEFAKAIDAQLHGASTAKVVGAAGGVVV